MGKVTYFNQPSEDKIEIDEDTKKALEEKERKEKLRREIRKSIFPWILFGITFLVGIFVIIYGAKPSLFRDKNFVSTQAIVITYEEKSGKDGGTYYYPVYSYIYDGEEQTITSDSAVYPLPFEVGEEITIYVNPNDAADIVTPIGDKFFIIFGIVIMVISIFALGMATVPVFEEAFPRANWPTYIFRYIPILIFLWSGVGLIFTQFKFPIKSVSIGLVLFILFSLLLIAFAGFVTVIMIKDIIRNSGTRKKEK